MKEEFILPDVWYVKVTEENKDILTKWKMDVSCGRYCNPAHRYFYVGHNGEGINTLEESRWEKSIEISFEQFMEYVLKKENMETPETFKITGSKPLLKAIWEELIEIGYTETSYTPANNYKELNLVCSNTPTFERGFTIKGFKKIFAGSYESDNFNKTFNLPEQYNEALQFAKYQLNHPYWVENFEPDITINGYKAEFGDGFVKFGCKKYDVEFLKEIKYLMEGCVIKSMYYEDINKIINYLKIK